MGWQTTFSAQPDRSREVGFAPVNLRLARYSEMKRDGTSSILRKSGGISVRAGFVSTKVAKIQIEIGRFQFYLR